MQVLRPKLAFLIALIAVVSITDECFSSSIQLQKPENKNLHFLHKYGPWLGAAIIGLPLFSADRGINNFSQRASLHSKSADNFFKPVHDFGQGYEYAVAIPILAYGAIKKNNRAIMIGGELIAGLAAQGILTETFKLSFGRLRPYQNRSPFRFFKGGKSFYSGDVSTSMTFATIIARNYSSQNLKAIGIKHNFPLIPILSYSIPILVAGQRLYSDNHWSSDVYFGGLAGFAVGTVVVNYGKRLHLKGFSLRTRPSRVFVFDFNF